MPVENPGPGGVGNEEIPTVDISFDELHKESSTSETKGTKRKTKTKRPDIALYRPGSSRSQTSNATKSETEVECSPSNQLESTIVPQKEAGSPDPELKSSFRKKRAEVQVYVPKPRQPVDKTEKAEDKKERFKAPRKSDSKDSSEKIPADSKETGGATAEIERVSNANTKSDDKPQNSQLNKNQPKDRSRNRRPVQEHKRQPAPCSDNKQSARSTEHEQPASMRDSRQKSIQDRRKPPQNVGNDSKPTSNVTEHDQPTSMRDNRQQSAQDRKKQPQRGDNGSKGTSNVTDCKQLMSTRDSRHKSAQDKKKPANEVEYEHRTHKPSARQKSVSFSTDDDHQTETDLNMSDLRESISALDKPPDADKSPGISKDSAARNRNRNNHRKQEARQTKNSKNLTHPSPEQGRRHKPNHPRNSAKSDSRLYDPYADTKEAEDSDSRRRKGMIKLPDSNASASTEPVATATPSRSGGALYNPDNPSQPIQVAVPNTSDYGGTMRGVASDYELMSTHESADGMGVAAPMMNSFMFQYYNVPPGGDFNYVENEECYQRQASASKQHKVTLLMRDVMPLERQLAALLSRRIEPGSLSHIKRLRLTVRDKLEQVILLDLNYTVSQNVDQQLWKSVYHHMIEKLRRELQEEEDDTQEVRDTIDSLLNEADEFYSNFLLKLEKSCDFSLSHYITAHRASPTSRSLKLALLMSQRFFICLGDVARYRTQNQRSTDYGHARRFYMRAASVAPKNGKPYNQLAIIALYAKRKLDTVFYFVRSIASSNAFLSAKESLRAIFHDIIKRYEQIRHETEQAKLKKLKSKNPATQSSDRHNKHSQISDYKRLETWISPIDGTVTDRVDDEDEMDPKKMPCNELYRRLMTTFLCCQGLIFSKVGMEHFPDASSEVLHQFQALLDHTPVPFLDLTKLIQMFAVCMFSIQCAGLQVGAASMENEKCRSYVQEQAILLFIDLTAIIANKCVQVLNTQTRSQPSLLLTADLILLLPIVKLAADWMTCHPHLWNPPPCPRDPLLGPVLDPWLSFAKLASSLSRINTDHVKFYSSDEVSLTDNSDSLVWLSTPEDTELRGFLPLMNLSMEDLFIKSHLDMEEAAQCYRASKLVTFADYLCGIEPAMLDFDTSTTEYKSLVDPPSLSEKTPTSRTEAISQHTDSDDVDYSNDELDTESVSEDEGVDGVGDEMMELRKKRRELQKQLQHQQRQQQAHQAVILQAVFEKEDHVIHLQVRPTRLIPDTNCFIEYLPRMKTLIKCKKFMVIVPLVVINELDGLSKKTSNMTDKFTSPDSEHGRMVQEQASQAIDFLENEFDRRNTRLKALTLSGTELETITYRSEEATTIGNNDDRILSCCLHYCTDHARDFMPRGKVNTITLARDVVLLTDDRNLRLKAHTRNVPVKDLLQFLEWGRIQ